MQTFAVKTDFNPHTREGCDDDLVTARVNDFISIHTPAKGVTVL